MPRSKEARLFYRCAYQRFEEAQILMRDSRTTGAVYLAGYAVECVLKALILSSVPASRRGDILQSFRGRHAHDYEWLKALSRRNGGAPIPAEVGRSFTKMEDWSTKLRYSATAIGAAEAEESLRAVEAILEWADERM